MSDIGFFVTWAVLLVGPVVGVFAAWNLHDQKSPALGKLCTATGAILLLVVGANLIGLATMSTPVNFACFILAFLAWCLLAPACWLLRPRLLGIIAGTLSCLSFVPGYLLGTIGALGLMFIVNDELAPPTRDALLASGLSCRVTEWGAAFSDVGYKVHLYRFLPWFPVLRVEVANVNVNETDPGNGPADASCESVATSRGYTLPVTSVRTPARSR